MNVLRPVAFLALFGAAASAHAITYTVNDAGSAGDSNLADAFCSTASPGNNTTCTLRAAIQEANDTPGAHIIKFAPAILKITLSAGLPTITAPVLLDGTTANVASGGRVEIDGGGVSGCIALADTDTVAHTDGASAGTGSIVKNLVVRRCAGHGISLSGHNYSVTGNRIGTNPGASSGSGAIDANSGAGISVSGTIAVTPPDLASLIATLPQGFAGVQALQASLQAALTVLIKPNLILGNVVSGNTGIGIEIFGQDTANTIVAANIVGLSQDGLSAVPNGRGPGGSVNRAGIRITGTAWGNFIGPGNIVSGNLGDGIALDPASVKLPNFIAGNLVGLGSAPGADVGNAVNGISVDTFPKTTAPVNPTNIAAIIGPANTISDNKSTSPSSDLDTNNADTSGGMIVTGSSRNVRVFANVFGLATIPAGSTPLGQLNFGNAGNGLVVTTPGNQIRNNLILANGRHGILLRGTSANNNIIRGNYVGVSVPTGLAPLVGLGNIGDGIHIDDAASNFIGGPAASDANVIAGNRRNGIAMRGSGAGWSNLVTRNRIYGNALDGSGIGIDLEHPKNAPDGLDTIANPGAQYPNLDQHRPALCGGAASPPVCGSTAGPSYDGSGGGTALKWTVLNRPNSSIRIEFFANAANGTDQTFLGEKVVSTDGAGLPTGAGCSSGVCTASVGGATDTTGMSIVATSTDLLPLDVPPSGGPLTPANNTSEFSDPLVATRKLEITTAPPLPGGTTNQPYSVTFGAIGGSGAYTAWAIIGGAAPGGVSLGTSTGVLSGTPGAAGSFTFSVEVTDSVGAKALAAYTIVIAAQPPLVITTATPLPTGTVGTAYGVTFTASGGNGAPGDWGLQAGALPPGLSLAAATGVLDGTPTAVGTYEFNVRVSDQSTTTVKAYTLTVVPAPVPLAITTASPLPNATATLSYSRTFAATGGSGIYTTWAITDGALPAGIVLGAATGTLSGKASAAGSFNFTVRVIDNAGAMATQAFALTVLAAPPQPPAAPVFSASPADIDFGAVDIGRTATVNVRLTNLDPDSSVTPRLTMPAASSGFTVDAGTCTAALAPNQFCTMMVMFTPTASNETPFSGSSSVCRSVFDNRCTIIFIGGGPPNLLARLTYRGVGTGTLAEVSPTKIDFGPQLIGTTSSVVVDIRNPTSGALLFTPQLTLSNPAQFTVLNSTCGIGQLGAGLACTLTFRFSPVVPGVAESSARLTIGNGTVSESYDIEVRGTGTVTAQPTYTTPMKLDFGRVDVGNIETIPVVTRNASGIPLTIAAAPFGAGDANVWGLSPNPCTNPIANTLSCTYSYRFSPRAEGSYSVDTQLSVTSSSGNSVDQLVPLSLVGTGIGSLVAVTPVSLDFGLVNVGTTSRGTVTITNTSNDTLTMTFSGVQPFAFSDTCAATIAPDASCSIFYRLAPDGEPLGPVVSQATLLFENAVTGNSQVVTVDLGATVVDSLFNNGFE